MESYKVSKRIGVGTYGSAYLVCLHSDHSQQFVLKKIKVDEENDKERQQAEMEVKLLSQLHHPLILGYVDHFMYKGHLCIITDYCESGDMYSLLRARKTPPSEPQILDWLVQIVIAIQHVHAHNILHRDLKTSNLFLKQDSLIKLGDFGISRPLNGSLDLARTIVGTPYYMSPEVMSNQPYGTQSDMWSLGCCLFEMMTLKFAFDASDMSSLVCKIMRGEHLPIPAQFSAELRDLVKALLSRIPSKRPTPEAILKLPWLKSQVSKTREIVAHASNSIGPKSRQLEKNTSGKSRRSSAAGGLDAELEAAKSRLEQINNQREALAARKERLANGVVVSGAGALVPPSAAAVRPPLPPAGLPGQNRHLLPVVQAQQHRAHSLGGFDPPNNGCKHRSASSDGADASSFDPKARREVKREQEIKAREAELLAARKAYYEERKQAEIMNYRLIHGEHLTGGHGPKVSPRDRQTSYAGSKSTDGTLPQQASSVVRPVRQSYTGEGAAEDLEAELHLVNQSSSAGSALQRTLSFEGNECSNTDRAAALRELCTNALGHKLTELVCKVIRQRNAEGGDQAAFQKELSTHLTPQQFQYLQLLDTLIWLEDSTNVKPTMQAGYVK